MQCLCVSIKGQKPQSLPSQKMPGKGMLLTLVTLKCASHTPLGQGLTLVRPWRYPLYPPSPLSPPRACDHPRTSWGLVERLWVHQDELIQSLVVKYHKAELHVRDADRRTRQSRCTGLWISLNIDHWYHTTTYRLSASIKFLSNPANYLVTEPLWTVRIGPNRVSSLVLLLTG